MPKAQGWSQRARQREAVPHMLPWTAGRYYTYPYGITLNTNNAQLVLLRLVPIYVPNLTGVIVTSIGNEVTTAGTTSSARFGIYSCNSDGTPGRLIIDGGTVVTTSTGFAAVAVSQFLRQGWYYLASVHKASVAPVLRRFSTPPLPQSVFGFQSVLDVGAFNGYIAIGVQADVAALVDNGLPAGFPAWTAQILQASTQDRIMVGI